MEPWFFTHSGRGVNPRDDISRRREETAVMERNIRPFKRKVNSRPIETKGAITATKSDITGTICRLRI
jgi:hypothetical protein